MDSRGAIQSFGQINRVTDGDLAGVHLAGPDFTQSWPQTTVPCTLLSMMPALMA